MAQLFNELEKDDQEYRRKAYDAERQDLLKRTLSNSENLDRTLLALSSGAIAVSVSFLQKNKPIQNLPLLYGAWGLLLLSVILLVLSYFLSKAAIERQLQIIQEYYFELNEDGVGKRTWLSFFNDLSTILASICFIVALALLIIFFSLNPN